jgi:hypothetical protein
LFLSEFPWDDTALLGDGLLHVEDEFRIAEYDITLSRKEIAVPNPQRQLQKNDCSEPAAPKHYLQVVFILVDWALSDYDPTQPLIQSFIRFESTEILSPHGQTHAGTI